MRNALLHSLGDTIGSHFRDGLERVVLKKRQQLQYPDQAIEFVYFPLSGLASVVAVNDEETRAEVGIIGCEGMTGVSVVHGVTRSPYSVFIQVEGEGFKVASSIVQDAVEKIAEVRQTLLKFSHLFMIQTSQTAIANARATLQQRLARWLLMAQDRLSSPNIAVTHEFLALMIAAHRPSLSVALQALASRGAVEIRPGSVLILNRGVLERHAGRFYGVTESEHKRLIG